MKTPISELSDYKLDWAVAQALKLEAQISDVYANGSRKVVLYASRNEDGFLSGRSFCPSEHASDGQPIVEKHGIGVARAQNGQWVAWTGDISSFESAEKHYGPTMLIAGMRCFVASAVKAGTYNQEHFHVD